MTKVYVESPAECYCPECKKEQEVLAILSSYEGCAPVVTGSDGTVTIDYGSLDIWKADYTFCCSACGEVLANDLPALQQLIHKKGKEDGKK